jgi:hypothetical protein
MIWCAEPEPLPFEPDTEAQDAFGEHLLDEARAIMDKSPWHMPCGVKVKFDAKNLGERFRFARRFAAMTVAILLTGSTILPLEKRKECAAEK